jgi:hypothetical protein
MHAGPAMIGAHGFMLSHTLVRLKIRAARVHEPCR